MENKFVPFRPRLPVRKYRRNLPHWRQDGGTYFVTFHTADSLPAQVLATLKRRALDFENSNTTLWSPADMREYLRLQRQIQKWLDAGRGTCPLKDPACASVVRDALLHFDGDRYIVDQFVVMPNHGHVIVRPLAGHPLESILHSWKSFSSQRLRHLKTGKPLWMEESFDHLIRTWESLERIRSYIQENPERANLQQGEYILGRGVGLVR